MRIDFSEFPNSFAEGFSEVKEPADKRLLLSLYLNMVISGFRVENMKAQMAGGMALYDLTPFDELLNALDAIDEGKKPSLFRRKVGHRASKTAREQSIEGSIAALVAILKDQFKMATKAARHEVAVELEKMSKQGFDMKGFPNGDGGVENFCKKYKSSRIAKQAFESQISVKYKNKRSAFDRCLVAPWLWPRKYSYDRVQ